MPVTRRIMIALTTLAAARPAAAQTQGKAMTTETGLKMIDTTVGTGATPKAVRPVSCTTPAGSPKGVRKAENSILRSIAARPSVSDRHEARHRWLG